MGIRRLAIEAKTFVIVVKKEADLFRCTITETGIGFLFSILLGWESARLVMRFDASLERRQMEGL